jgi:hypothetical protein
VDFSEIPTGSTVSDRSFAAEGLDIASMNQVTIFNSDGSVSVAGEGSTTTDAAYPSNGPFVIAPIGNAGVVPELNSEGIEFSFIGPGGTLLSVPDEGFDLIPFDWQSLSGPITVEWANLQYLSSLGTSGRLVQTSYTPSDDSVIHISSPSGGDWVFGAAYASNLSAPVFGVDNVGWNTYKTPTASQQGRGSNPSARPTTCSSGDPGVPPKS